MSLKQTVRTKTPETYINAYKKGYEHRT